MRKFLAHDAATGELRLVFTDLWAGQHERTEYTVATDDGKPLRGRPDLAGHTVHQDGGLRWYVLGATSNHRNYFPTMGGTADTVKTPCRRLASKSGRAQCALCQADPTIPL